jgi:hypothetical protein
MQHVAENLYSKCADQNLKDIFKNCAKKKKERRWKEGMRAIRREYPDGYDYLLTVGKHRENDADERPSAVKWAQCKDGGYRWGIMTSNGSKSLNRVFKAVSVFACRRYRGRNLVQVCLLV